MHGTWRPLPGPQLHRGFVCKLCTWGMGGGDSPPLAAEGRWAEEGPGDFPAAPEPKPDDHPGTAETTK